MSLKHFCLTKDINNADKHYLCRDFLYQEIPKQCERIEHLRPYNSQSETFRNQFKKVYTFKGLGQQQEQGAWKLLQNESLKYLLRPSVQPFVGLPLAIIGRRKDHYRKRRQSALIGFGREP